MPERKSLTLPRVFCLLTLNVQALSRLMQVML